MELICELNGVMAAKYFVGLFYLAKIMKQSYRPFMAIVNNRCYTMRHPTIYPNEKFLSELDLIIPQSIPGLRPESKEIVDYVESFSSTGFMYNMQSLTYIVWDTGQLYAAYKELEKMKCHKSITNVRFYHNGHSALPGGLVPLIDYVEIYNDGNRIIASELSPSRLSSGIIRNPRACGFDGLNLYEGYAPQLRLVGYVRNTDAIEQSLWMSDSPIDVSFGDKWFNHDIVKHLELCGDIGRFGKFGDNLNSRTFISRNMLPKEFQRATQFPLTINVYESMVQYRIFLWRFSKLIANRFILSADVKFMWVN